PPSGRASSLRSSAGWLGWSGITEHLYAMVVRVGDVDAILAIDEHPGRQLKFFRSVSTLAEVVKQLSLLVEDLHGFKKTVDHVEIVLAIEPDALGTEHAAVDFADLANAVEEFAG